MHFLLVVLGISAILGLIMLMARLDNVSSFIRETRFSDYSGKPIHPLLPTWRQQIRLEAYELVAHQTSISQSINQKFGWSHQ